MKMINKENLKGYKYAIDVINGKEIANKWVKLECERYINRLNGLDDEIYFDYKEANRIYKLLKCMNYATGFYANEPIYNHACGFQFMAWENIFCWYYKKSDSMGFKKRVVEEVYLEIGRKAGKSFFAGVTQILIMLRASNYAQTAISGLTRDISSLVRNSIVEIINSSPLISKHFKITRDKITCLLNNSTCKHTSGEANNLNGLLLSSYIVDEVANQTDSRLIDVLKLSQMSTKTRLAIYISTQYAQPINAFNDLLDYHKSILSGALNVKNTFGLLFELDEGDDYTKELNWYKCNPLQMSMENGREFLRSEFEKGKTIPSAMLEFRIKILNERLTVNKNESYLDFNKWRKCRVNKIDFKGKNVVVALDLSVDLDLTSVSIAYKENNKVYAKSHGFLPKGNLNKRRENIDYYKYSSLGYCTLHEGDTVNYNKVEEYIRNIESEYNCKIDYIIADPYNCKQISENLASDYNVIMLRQSYNNLSPATQQLKYDVYNENFFYEKNELLDWCVTNAVLNVGKSGHIMLAKDVSTKNKKRIDLLATIIFCYTQLLENNSYDSVEALEEFTKIWSN